MHRCHTQNLAPLPPPKLSTHHAVDSRSDRIAGLVDENAGVVVEADNRAIGALDLLLCSHDDSVSNVSSLDLVRCGSGTHSCVGGATLLLDDGYYSVA